ncbi:MAG: Txe/YoeB family addiction module toxin [Synergistaceae bacterium]|nr:Txe/YoeB family addiction module toxin [Synergistaceae bacterium]
MYLIEFSKRAEKDKKLLKAAGLERNAKELLNIIMINPFQNPPRYEKLLGNLQGNFSRRTNIQHRLIYNVRENSENLSAPSGEKYEGIVNVERMWTHYDE